MKAQRETAVSETIRYVIYLSSKCDDCQGAKRAEFVSWRVPDERRNGGEVREVCDCRRYGGAGTTFSDYEI